MSFQYCRTLLIICLILYVGCNFSKNQEIPDHIKQVENLIIFKAPDEFDTITFSEEHRFHGNKDLLIGTINEVTVDDSESVYIADNKQKQIFVFNSDGTFKAKIGNEGRGPGEFSYISVMKPISTELLIFDSSLSRLSVFSVATLELIETVKLNTGYTRQVSGLEGKFPGHYILRSDGGILVGFRSPININNAKQGRIIAYYLFSKDRQFIPESILTLKERKIYPNTHGDIPRYPQFSFSPHSLVTLSDDNYVLSAWTKDFMIEVRGPKGEYIRSIFYPIHKVAVNKNRLLERYTSPVRQRIIKNEEIPDTWPALNDLLVDDKNRLWVSTNVEDFDIYEWWVLEETGELITKFEWPRDEPIEVIKNGKMYTRQTDEETSLQQVVRYGIEME